jgi:hypothetical protein
MFTEDNLRIYVDAGMEAGLFRGQRFQGAPPAAEDLS